MNPNEYAEHCAELCQKVDMLTLQIGVMEEVRAELEKAQSTAAMRQGQIEYLRQQLTQAQQELAAERKVREELVKALEQTFGEYLGEDYSDIPDGRSVGEFSAADLNRAIIALANAATKEGKC